MHIERLSARKVATAKPGLYCDGGGLYLQVTTGKGGRVNRSWLFRYATPEIVVSKQGRPHRRSRDMGLGPLATISLHEARELARQCRQMRLAGIDPIEHRKAKLAEKQQEAAKIKTFEECAVAYVAAHGIGWRSQKHADQWITSLQRFAFPVIGKLPVSKVDTPLLLKILQPIWLKIPATADRLRGRIEAVLNWATAGKYRTGDNPAEWNHLKFLLPAVDKLNGGGDRHLAAIPYAEIGSFVIELRKVDSSAARALEFAILTGTRTREILGAKWGELEGNVWNIPAGRTKSGRPHRVPLSDAALAVIERQRSVQRDQFIFPGTIHDRGLGDKAMAYVLADLGRSETVHGMRSAFRDWVAEQTSYSRELAEVALGHAVGDDTERAYQRGDLLEKRRRLMQAWADYCAKPAPIGEATPATPIRAVS